MSIENKAYKDDKKYWYHKIDGLPNLKIKKYGKIKEPNKEIIKFDVGKYVLLPQSTNPKKIFILQEIFFEKKDSKDYHGEVRLGYYIIGKKPQLKGKWVWGQFATFIPKRDLIKLIDLARQKGILS
jgi:mRNA-degrading endonuclease RelE of RelBE toxin-antitoxin system